jgi:hypothetical protein
MRFFNQKEEMLKIELTPHGEELFSKGLFRPVYYSFSDDGISYNKQLAPGSITEVQNSSSVRIVDETPYTLPQMKRFPSSEFSLDLPLSGSQSTIFNSMASNINSIGSVTLSGAAAPNFRLTFLEGELKATSNFYTSGSNINSTNPGHPDLLIPQIDVDLEFKVAIDSFTATKPPFKYDPFLSKRTMSSDGGTPYVQSKQLTFLVEELNTDDKFENFELEVYEIGDTIDPDLGNYPLRKLNFIKQTADLKVEDDILINAEDLIRKQNLMLNYPATTNDAEYYFDVFTDTYEEISEDFICSLISQLRSQGFALDIGFDCPDTKPVNDDQFNIYDSDAGIEKCP